MHAQPPGEASQDFLAGLELCAQIAIGVLGCAEIALVRYRRRECPCDETLVEEREARLLAPIRDGSVVAPEVAFAESADVEVKLVKEALETVPIVRCRVAGVAGK